MRSRWRRPAGMRHAAAAYARSASEGLRRRAFLPREEWAQPRGRKFRSQQLRQGIRGAAVIRPDRHQRDPSGGSNGQRTHIHANVSDGKKARSRRSGRPARGQARDSLPDIQAGRNALPRPIGSEISARAPAPVKREHPARAISRSRFPASGLSQRRKALGPSGFPARGHMGVEPGAPPRRRCAARARVGDPFISSENAAARRPTNDALSQAAGRQGGVRAGLWASRRPDARPRERATRQQKARDLWRPCQGPPVCAHLVPAFHLSAGRRPAPRAISARRDHIRERSMRDLRRTPRLR